MENEESLIKIIEHRGSCIGVTCDECAFDKLDTKCTPVGNHAPDRHRRERVISAIHLLFRNTLTKDMMKNKNYKIANQEKGRTIRRILRLKPNVALQQEYTLSSLGEINGKSETWEWNIPSLVKLELQELYEMEIELQYMGE